ncbi:MAG: hypothetical protein JSS72_03830 [Armatimonadetes bacterium]|nr:hypothetical protein [Armatimonadota bacterium]
MRNIQEDLAPFAKRVRLARGWRGIAQGASAGAAICIVWATLDAFRLVMAEWQWLGITFAVCALAGLICGFVIPVSSKALTKSIDRRAALKDRLTTATERTGESGVFDEALQADASEALREVSPKKAFPLRFTRLHGGSLALGALAAMIFMLGNSPLLMSPGQRKERDEVHAMGEAVERVAKEQFQKPDSKQDLTPEEKRLAGDMMKLARELERARIPKEQALQKQNELAQKANDLAKQAEGQARVDLANAQTAEDQLAAAASVANMSESEKTQMASQLSKAMTDLQNRMSQLQKEQAKAREALNKSNLSQAGREALQRQLSQLSQQGKGLSSQMQALQQKMKTLQLSKEAMDVFRKLVNDPLYKQILELQRKLQGSMKQGANGKMSALSDEELKELQRKLEALAKRLNDPEEMKKFLQAMLDAAKHAKQMGRGNGAGLGLGLGSGMGESGPQGGASAGGGPSYGPGAPTQDIWAGDTQHVNKLDKPVENRGTTHAESITGEQRPGDGSEPYVEIKAPTFVGTRSSVPYQRVMPSYKRRAESALERQQIPKKHEKRVKEYFDSLTGAGGK